MTDKEIIRNHYIFSTTHELDDDNKFLKEYILNLEHENKQLKEQQKFLYHIRQDTTSIPSVVRKASDVEIIKKLKQHEQNKKLEKIKSYLETTYTEWFNWKNDILEILESNKED